MATFTINEDERALVNKSLMEFAIYAHVDTDFDLNTFPAIRRLQIEHHRWQQRALDPRADCSLAVLNLGIVEEACWELPIAIEADDRDETHNSLGDILIYTLGVCTDLRLDFLTLARNFEPDNLEAPQGLDGIMNLFKGIGMLAHVVMHHRQYRRGYGDITKTREDAGAAIARICSAVHWLCFSNDWEVTVLFQEVIEEMMRKRDWTKNAIDGETPTEPVLTERQEAVLVEMLDKARACDGDVLCVSSMEFLTFVRTIGAKMEHDERGEFVRLRFDDRADMRLEIETKN